MSAYQCPARADETLTTQHTHTTTGYSEGGDCAPDGWEYGTKNGLKKAEGARPIKYLGRLSGRSAPSPVNSPDQHEAQPVCYAAALLTLKEKELPKHLRLNQTALRPRFRKAVNSFINNHNRLIRVDGKSPVACIRPLCPDCC